ncbi:MAG: 50S ribosomal protein L13 [Bacteroidales bacterium]
MDTLSYKTKSANKATVNKTWYVIDAEDKVLGRLASGIAVVLRGKHKPDFTPHVDCGDNVIVINAEKVILTGKKMTDRHYVRYSGYPSGKYTTNSKEILEKQPHRLVENAVRGMLPHNRLGRKIFKNMHVYTGPEHDHKAQKPKNLDLNSIK